LPDDECIVTYGIPPGTQKVGGGQFGAAIKCRGGKTGEIACEGQFLFSLHRVDLHNFYNHFWTHWTYRWHLTPC